MTPTRSSPAVPNGVRRGLALVGLLAGLGLAGCTLVPKYERPPTSVPDRFPTSATPATAGLPGGAGATNLNWRAVFTDDRLARLIEVALTNNLDLRVAALNVELTRAQYRISLSARLPTVDAGAGYVAAGDFAATRQAWTASLGTTAYEVDLFGRVRSLNQRALQQYFASEQAQRGAQLALVAEVADQYFRWRQAEEQLALARRTLASVEESFALNRATFDAGATSELDFRTAEGQVQTARINVVTYERRIEQIRHGLALLLGQPLPEELPAPRPFDDPALVANVPPGLTSDLVQRRPDILEAEHVLQAANANIGAARAAFFPTITFTGEIGTTSSQLAQLFGSGTGVWSFAPQVTVPVFTGGRNRADLDAARLSRRIEVARYQRSIQIAFREVADSLVEVESYEAELRAQAALIATQQKRFDLATARYREGEDSYLNVLTAQEDLYTAQQNYLQARLLKLASQVALYKALGGGWE